MYILTRAEPIENYNSNICQVHSAAIEKQWLDAGYQIYERRYLLRIHHKEYTVSCPEFRKKGAEPIVVIPEFLVPGRRYPVYVYMYAISLYIRMPGKGQRWASEETRKRFGLASFAHTTLGRALKSFVRCTGCEPASISGAAGAVAADARKKGIFPGVRSTEPLRKKAALSLGGMPLGGEKQQAVIASLKLAREFFTEYRRFLL